MTPKAAIATLLLLCGGLIGFLMSGVSVLTTRVGQDFACQCDAAVGPTSSAVADSCLAQSDADAVPTRNIYADLTFPASDTAVPPRTKACLSAMSLAPFQQPPLAVKASGPGTICAEQRARSYLGKQISDRQGGANDWDVVAAIARLVMYQAAVAGTTGQCLPADPRDLPSSASCLGSAETAPGTPGTAPLLPSNVAEQALCGQRVTTAAVSPGDLVYWRYTEFHATRMGIAVTDSEKPGHTMIVTIDPSTQTITLQQFPPDPDLIVRRVPLHRAS